MPRLRIRLLALAVFLLVFPFFLRRRPRVERRITILAPPEQIFPLINDLRAWRRWTPWHRREDLQVSYGDTAEGTGAVQRWRGRGMDGILRITRSDAAERVDYECELGGGEYQLLGRIELVKDGACTRVAWRCVWEPALNPYRRYFDLFCRWMIGRDLAEGLANLKRVAEEGADRARLVA